MDPDASDRDVDARFLLANERTVLAWIRTSLTLLAVGAGLLQFGTEFAGHRSLALMLLVSGVACAAAGARRYVQADRALREGRLPATGRAPHLLALAVGLAGCALILAVLFD